MFDSPKRQSPPTSVYVQQRRKSSEESLEKAFEALNVGPVKKERRCGRCNQPGHNIRTCKN